MTSIVQLKVVKHLQYDGFGVRNALRQHVTNSDLYCVMHVMQQYGMCKLGKRSYTQMISADVHGGQGIDLISLPKHWPSHIKYIRKNQKSSIADASHSQGEESVRDQDIIENALKLDVNSELNVPSEKWIQCHDNIMVKKLPPDHVAYDSENGYGLYATSTIVQDDVLGEYVGIILDHESKHKYSSDFFMNRGLQESHEEFGSIIDAQEAGNEMRFINDYRGIAARENCYCIKKNGRVFVLAKRTLSPGEEILLNYGHNYWYGDHNRLKILSFKERMKIVFKIYWERYTVAMVMIVISVLLITQSLIEQRQHKLQKLQILHAQQAHQNQLDKMNVYEDLKQTAEVNNEIQDRMSSADSTQSFNEKMKQNTTRRRNWT